VRNLAKMALGFVHFKIMSDNLDLLLLEIKIYFIFYCCFIIELN